MIRNDQLTDAQLVTLYQNTNTPEYFGNIYNRFHKKVYHYCLGIMKNREDAYDVTADTFVKLSDKIKTLRNAELFVAWLFRIAHNECMNKIKGNMKYRSSEINGELPIADDAEDIRLENMEKEIRLELLDQVMDKLDEGTRFILVEKYINDKSIEELEELLNLSKSAVKMRLARGKQKVAVLMNNRRRILRR